MTFRRAVAVTTHKEEMPSRKASDAADRVKLKEKLDVLLPPLHINHEDQDLTNIATGGVAGKKANAERAVEIGKQQQKEFEAGWPETFHAPLKKKVVTMAESRKRTNIDEVQNYDPGVIYFGVCFCSKL